jgi:hypothetical protein
VFASTFEEATFANGLSSTFTFVGESSLPTIDPVLVKTWDATDLSYHLTITGSDYDSADTTSTVDVFLGGIKQTTESITTGSTGELNVKVTDLVTGSGNTIEVYFGVGLPVGADAGDFIVAVDFEPKLVQLSTLTISGAGSTLYAVVEGAGTGDSLTLVDSSNVDICDTATMLDYALLECVTNSGLAYATTEQLSVKNTASGAIYACGNTNDVAQCSISILSTLLAPSYSAVVAETDGTTLTFTGTNLNTFGLTNLDCEVWLHGIKATTCTITDFGSAGTSVEAEYDDGVPVSATETVPVLKLREVCNTATNSKCDIML